MKEIHVAIMDNNYVVERTGTKDWSFPTIICYDTSQRIHHEERTDLKETFDGRIWNSRGTK